LDAQPPEMKQALRRSTSEKVSTKQMVECFQRSGWSFTPAIASLLQEHTSGLVQTQIVEDVIGHQKNKPDGTSVIRYKRPIASMCSALAAEVIQTRHKFETVHADFGLASKADKPDPTHFEYKVSQQSLPFGEIATTASMPKYYSPKAEWNGTPAADLSLMKDFVVTRDTRVFVDADLGMVCDFRHRLLLQKVGEIDEGRWNLALIHFPTSAALLWPCSRRQVADRVGYSYFELDADVRSPLLTAIHDLANWKACTLKWRSWAWQVLNTPQFALAARPAIRPFLAEGPDSLYAIACKAAFWNLSKAGVVRLAKAMKVPVEASAGLCAVLEAAIVGGLGFLWGATFGESPRGKHTP
jgi:hypothetical protein